MSKNDETSGMVYVFAFVATGALLLGALALTVLTFISVILTFLCLTAWHKPRLVFGHTLTPDEARAFVYRGLAGALLVPSFVLFATGMYGQRINPDYILYFVVGGYGLGSVVIGYQIEKMKAEEADKAAAMQLMLPPEPVRPAHRPTVEPSPSSPEQAAFRFATWDDEEELRK